MKTAALFLNISVIEKPGGVVNGVKSRHGVRKRRKKPMDKTLNKLWCKQADVDLQEFDIVYTVKEGEVNEELKYSLRSLENIPHRKVVIVGHKPDWVKGVFHLPVKQNYGTKVANTNWNWLTVANSKLVSDRFILMNDDMFFMKPITAVPFCHMGDHKEFLKYYIQNHPFSTYTKVIRATEKRLGEMGITDAYSYELHTPTFIDKRAIRKAFKDFPFQFSPVNIRTLALNLMEVAGTHVPDVKYYSEKEQSKNPSTQIENLPVVSTNDKVWAGPIGEYIRSQFDDKGSYEK